MERAVTGGERDASSAERIGVAMAAGAISSVLYSPVDLIVIQQQKLGLDSVAGTVRAVTSNHGMAGLMRGFSACVVREAIFTAGYLGECPLLAVPPPTPHTRGAPARRAAVPRGVAVAPSAAAHARSACVAGDTDKSLARAGFGWPWCAGLAPIAKETLVASSP